MADYPIGPDGGNTMTSQTPLAGKSLKKRLAWQIGLFFVLMVSLSTLLVGWLLQAQLAEESRNALREIAWLELRRLEERVAYLMETTQSLTGHQFVINGLQNPAGRRTTLPALAENFAKNRDILSFALVDFAGHPVFVQAQEAPDYSSFPPLRQALAMGQPNLFIARQHNRLVVVAPVDHDKTIQGAVVVEFDLQNILKRLLRVEKEHAYQIRDAQGPLFTFQEQQYLEVISVQVTANATEMPWLDRLGLQLQLSVPLSIHESTIRHALFRFSALGLLFIFLAGAMAVHIGNSIATPILTLCRRVARQDGTLCAPLGTGDELETLAQTFDQQTQALRNNQEVLEQRVEARTQALRQSEQMLQIINQELAFQKRALDEHAIVSATDVTGRITYVNDKFVAISGYTHAELLGQNHRIIKSGAHPPALYQEMWTTIAHGRPWHGEIKNQARDGSFYWVSATIVPFLNEQGKPFQYISIRTDITAMKALETSLLAAKEQAEAAVRAKSAFLANMSHEIRTPMNAIIGLSYLCLQTPLTDRQQDYLHKVHHAATSLLRIINDILDYSKIEAGRLDLESIVFTLEEVLSSLSSMVAWKAHEKRLAFLMETAVDMPPHLVGDPLRLGQVLINLANNAIKFTEQGEVVVATEVLHQDAARVCLQFTVRDTGLGMTPEQQAGLFQAFTQADSSITRRFGGTGLGLAISERLVAMMGGTIRVESAPGQGSRFVFAITLGVADQTRSSQETSRPQEIPHSALQTYMAALAGTRILLVEDNEINQQVARELLEQANVTVLLAENGREALDLVAREPLDGILMDMHMPVMDGLTATREIRRDPRFAQLPILAMTANAMSGDREQCLAAGMQDHIAKPVNPVAMYATLAQWIHSATPVPTTTPAEPLGQTSAVIEPPALPALPGVDTQTGLLRMGGNRQGYLTLLAKFRTNQGEVDAAIRAALATHDTATAERLAHTLSGVAGTIGAGILADRAKQLESALRAQADWATLEPLLQAVAVELTQVCTTLDMFLPQTVPAETTPPVAVETPAETAAQINQRNQLVRKAAEQLAIFDAEIEHTLVALRDCAGSQAMRERVIRMERQVAQYDFEGAAEALKQCAPLWQIDLGGGHD
ncbi:MAG: response regulator [Magnetococcales bacterium]|nr:response regulator [Magnetococcales bacterium]